MPSKIYTIIVAAGSGNRFGGDLPKQFALLAGKPVLMHAIDAFSPFVSHEDIILVLSQSEVNRWHQMCEEYQYTSPAIAIGGSSRTESVRNALKALDVESADENDIVIIHDGARPLVDKETIASVVAKLGEPGVSAVVPSTAMTDSLMTAAPDDSIAVDRSTLVAVQTPQGFDARTLAKAYSLMGEDITMTDDASVVSRYAGVKVHLVEGSRRNIKITYPLDIRIAELFLSENA